LAISQQHTYKLQDKFNNNIPTLTVNSSRKKLLARTKYWQKDLGLKVKKNIKALYIKIFKEARYSNKISVV